MLLRVRYACPKIWEKKERVNVTIFAFLRNFGSIRCSPYHTALAMPEIFCCVFCDIVRSQSTMIVMRKSRLHLICLNINNFELKFRYTLCQSVSDRKKNYTHAPSFRRNCSKTIYANYVYAIKLNILNTKLLNCVFVCVTLFRNYWKLVCLVAWVPIILVWRCITELISQHFSIWKNTTANSVAILVVCSFVVDPNKL